MSTNNLEGEFQNEKEYERKSEEEITQIARGIYKNEIFSSLQIDPKDQNLVISIFMPLAFLSPLMRKQLVIDEITNFYAEMKNAGPKSINGYPCFFSVYYLDREDTERVINKYEEILILMGESSG